jgi:hypothetical protein
MKPYERLQNQNFEGRVSRDFRTWVKSGINQYLMIDLGPLGVFMKFYYILYIIYIIINWGCGGSVGWGCGGSVG